MPRPVTKPEPKPVPEHKERVGDIAEPIAFRVAAPAAKPEERKAALRAAVAEETKAPAVDPEAPMAVLVMHGMGQQVPFSTLEDVALALQAADRRALGPPRTPKEENVVEADVTARTVRLGDEKAQRIELDLHARDGQGNLVKRPVRLYEAYWAPLTEGVIGLRGVMGFLFHAGLDGIRRVRRTSADGTPDGKDVKPRFQRWMFGKLFHSAVAPGTRRTLLFILLVLGVLVAFNAVVAAVAVAYVAPGSAWPSATLLLDLDALVVALVAVLFLLVGVPMLRTKSLVRRSVALHEEAAVAPEPLARGEAARASLRAKEAATRWSRRGMFLVWVAAVFALLGGVALLALVVLHALGGHVLPRVAWLESESGGLARAFWVSLPFWGALWVASAWVRSFIVQYVGDVAIYISPQRLDAYAATRKAIKDAAGGLAHGVYASLEEKEDKKAVFQHSRVAVVGHSLGSVVAYDTLNRLLDEDRLDKGARQVQKRTAMLLTFGSPLDKTAFIFGVSGKGTSHVREKLATSVQPLIQAKDFRDIPWLNVHSPADIISGPLDYYDDPRWKEDEDVKKRVQNAPDPHALTPLMAHVEYWKSPLAWDKLREQLLAPRDSF